jgi:hypothetical protein
VKVSGVDVFFGRPALTPPPPVPLNLNPLQNFPAPLEATPVFQAPAAIPIATPPAPVVLCPKASPLANPAEQAPVEPPGPPAAGTYPFRVVGTETEGGTTMKLPTEALRQVKPLGPMGTDGSYNFTVVQTYDNQVTSMMFNVQTVGTGGSSLPGETPVAGIYLTQMTDDSGDAFTPSQPGVLLMPLPVTQNSAFQGAGADPQSAKTMEINPQGGTVGTHDRVDACGTVIDAFKVEIVGKMVDSNSNGCPAGTTTCGQQKDFDLTFDDAPQFGGLMLADHLKETGTDESTGNQFIYDIASTINVVPGR